jgi:hypothetical protein
MYSNQPHTETTIIKPTRHATDSVKAEYHKLRIQQIERYSASRWHSKPPQWLHEQLLNQLSQHKRLAKYHASRAKSTDSCSASTSYPKVVGLATMQMSGVHQ